MREILFRGKRKDNGEWVEGYLYIQKDGACEITYYNEVSNIEHWTRDVIPETVGQYTGLNDKNGKPIFEGDIVSGVAYSNVWTGVIVYIPTIASFGVRYSYRHDATA